MSDQAQVDKTRWNSVVVDGSTYTVERAPELLAKIDLSLIQFTPACEKFPHKDQCRCCKMYFEKKSVNFSVPNHRVIDMQRLWNLKIEGARYSTASYLYTNSSVCVFCSQLFSSVEEKSKNNNKLMKTKTSSTSRIETVNTEASEFDFESSVDSMSMLESTSESNLQTSTSLSTSKTNSINDSRQLKDPKVIPPKLEITTQIKRANVAIEKRTYQSTDVDNMISSNAITVPYHLNSRTRREVDPWWEIDFGRPYHFHSLSFRVMKAKSQALFVNIVLLEKPLGFENPFLDSVSNKSLHTREFVIEEGEAAKQFADVYWELPSGSICTAVRVQLRGVHTMCIGNFRAFLGDNFVANNAEQCRKILEKSFATVSPTRLDSAMASMLSPTKKRELTTAKASTMVKKKIVSSNKEVMNKMGNLDKMVSMAYNKKQIWASKVNVLIQSFKISEIRVLFQQIFLPAVIEGIKNGNSKNNLPKNVKYKNPTDLNITEEELLIDGLNKHYPRCELTDLHNRIRSMILMIQSSSTHQKLTWVGDLQQNEDLLLISEDSNELIGSMLEQFKFVDDFISGKLETWKDKNGKPKKGRTDPSVDRGCSWSQFCIIIALFIDRKVHLIPSIAFGINTTNGILNALDMYAEVVAGSRSSSRIGTTQTNINHIDDFSALDFAGSSTGPARISSSAPAGIFFADTDGEFKSTDLAKEKNTNECTEDKSPLLFAARDPNIPVLDTRFSEYKLSNFSKRFNGEFDFPKELTLDFTNMYLEAEKSRRAGTANLQTRTVETENNSSGKLGFGETEPIPPASNLTTLPLISSALSTDISQSNIVKTEEYGAPRVCSLCNKRFSFSATKFKVLFKHIVTIRKHWDPSLLSKDIQMLEQGTSMFNLVNICVFCNQYFFPDFPNGIFFPLQDKKIKKVKKTLIPDADKGPVSTDLYFDSRYPVETPVGSWSKRTETATFRQNAKAAKEIAVIIKEEIELERIRALEK